jgi:YaiO family outer membrane protein
MNAGTLRPFAAALVVFALATPPAHGQSRGDVRQALYAGDHEAAITLALEALRAEPANAEIRFLLARAYGYSGRWDEAEAIVDRLLAEHPADADIIVFKARLRSWHGDLEGAERFFRRALEAQPRSADALAGLADLASWRGEFDAALVFARQALDLDADHAGALFRVGSVLLWQGDYGRARGYLTRAAELDPSNEDYRLGLEKAVPVYARRTEVWLTGRNEHWSDGRRNHSDLGLAVLFGLFNDRAKFVAKAGRSWRADGRDDHAGLEAYPRLWKGAYGYLDLSLAPGAESLPSYSFHLELYQTVLTRFEVSLGYRRTAFEGGGVSTLVASGAAYWGAWYPHLRLSLADTGAETAFNWTAGLRRYLSDTSYVWSGIGRGTRWLETGTVEDVLAGPAWIFDAGFDLCVIRDIRLRGYVSHREGIGGADSTAVSLTVGYRF